MKEKLKNNKIIYMLYIRIYRLFSGNRVRKGKARDNNQVILNNAKLNHCEITVNGKNNIIEVASQTLLKDCVMMISGNNCKICIGEKNTLIEVSVVCEDDGSSVLIGNGCIFAGEAHLASTEGKRIVIEGDFLCSNAVTIRTGDSHSIFNADRERINRGGDVRIGKHVWIGNQVIILKGTDLAENLVIGSGSVVKGVFGSGVVIAGNPARIIKEHINWDFYR